MSLYLKVIRGEVNSEITNEYASNLGSILGNFLSPESLITVGRDDKSVSQMISQSLTAGIMAAGRRVADFGVVPTPVVHYLTSFSNGNLLLIINNHHNTVLISIYSNYQIHLEHKRPEMVRGEYLGQITHIKELIDRYQNAVIEQIIHKNIHTRKPKIILQCQDKGVIPFITQVLNSIGVEIILMTFETPVDTINRKTMEVEPESISIVSQMVKSISADLGIILDNNGEQAFFIDENGDLIRDQTVLSIFAKYMLKKQKGVVISSIVASLALDEVVKTSGGKLLKTPVDAILKELDNPDVIFAGDEPGKYIFPQFQSCSDAIFASAKLIDIICAEDKPLSRLKEEIPEYQRTGFSVKCDHELKPQAIELLKNELMEKGKLTTVDGVRADFDNSYILIRASSFEPILKIYLEAKNPEKLGPLTREVNNIIDLIDS